MIALWTGAMYLWKQNKGGWQHYIAVIPAIFMTMVTFTYILQAPEGFGLPTSITYPAGVIITIFWAIVYFKSTNFQKIKLKYKKPPLLFFNSGGFILA